MNREALSATFVLAAGRAALSGSGRSYYHTAGLVNWAGPGRRTD